MKGLSPLVYFFGALTLLIGGSAAVYVAFSLKRPAYGALLAVAVLASTLLEGAFRVTREAEKPRPDWSTWLLLNHEVGVLEIEWRKLHHLFASARDASTDTALSAIETTYRIRTELIIRQELTDHPGLIDCFFDDTGFQQTTPTDRKTEMTNFLERRTARLREAIDYLKGEIARLNVTKVEQ
jgi:hypothetical protein